MITPSFVPLPFSYQRDDSNIWILNIDDIPVKKELIKDVQIVYISPKGVGGNHMHARTEWFVAVGDFVLVWIDAVGVKHENNMSPNGTLQLTKVPPFLPHAVVNQSTTQFGVLYEMADAKTSDVKPIMVFEKILDQS